MPDAPPRIQVEHLTMRFGERLVQRDLNFTVRTGSIFVIMGGSGCGKSTLLKHMTGLIRPAEGAVRYDGVDYWSEDDAGRAALGRRFGILFQNGALWSSMTLAQNVALPMELFLKLDRETIDRLVSFKLTLVGLDGFGGFSPSEISGGMRKRAGLARALALEPDVLFLDEPSAGLDPVTSQRLDELILRLRDGLGVTVVVVTHELASIFAIADDGIFLDAEAKTAIAHGDPKVMRERERNPTVRAFLTRGGSLESAIVTPQPTAGTTKPADAGAT
jgi:phospholipid/cholesterol/gamma-HCH transport system ATP-binding protein